HFQEVANASRLDDLALEQLLRFLPLPFEEQQVHAKESPLRVGREPPCFGQIAETSSVVAHELRDRFASKRRLGGARLAKLALRPAHRFLEVVKSEAECDSGVGRHEGAAVIIV